MLIMYRHKQTSDINLLDRKKCFQINRSSATEQMFRTFFAKKNIDCVVIIVRYTSYNYLQRSQSFKFLLVPDFREY